MIRTQLIEKLPAIAATALFSFFVLLHLIGARDVADFAIGRWAVHPYPFRFLDTDTVLSAARCFNKGIDAYVTNPCDDLGRVYTYSPLWMRLLAPFPVSEAWIAPAGLLIDIVFLASLFLLPAMRDLKMAVGVTLGAVSSAAVFAIERGNNDLVLFALVACTAALAARKPVLRYLGYGAALLAGLLKYYPLAVMAIALREKTGRFLIVTLVSLSVTALFVAAVWPDLWKAFGNIPEGSWWYDMYGAEVFGGGIAELNSWPAWSAVTIRLVMTIIALAAGIFFALQAKTSAAIETLSTREWDFLLVGALITLGCFFTAQNIGYRSIHVLLTLPGLFIAARIGGFRFSSAPYLALALMWAMAWRGYGVALAQALSGGQAELVFFILWLLRELIWWWFIVLLLSLVIAYVLRAPIVADIVERISPALPASASHRMKKGPA